MHIARLGLKILNLKFLIKVANCKKYGYLRFRNEPKIDFQRGIFNLDREIFTQCFTEIVCSVYWSNLFVKD